MIYPNVDFIRTETGEDLIINVGTEIKANAEIKQYVNTLLGELRNLNTLDNYNKIRTLIEENPKWNSAWMSAVASFIYEDYNSEKERDVIANETILKDPLLSIRRVLKI